jgi:D-glycero-alpha-D-manno-heptose-7-phosphate kinase
MVISQTPYRISFFGGGTDYPTWYRENGGATLSTTIDKYCYISCRYLPPFFEHKHRIVYSLSEEVNEIDEIMHPAAREAFRFMNVERGVEVHHDGDLPARAGLASSSAFTVGMLHALYALSGRMVTKKQLANDAIHVEQELIKENVGSQDQVAAAFGGFNHIEYSHDGSIRVTPIIVDKGRLDDLQNHIMLYFTGFSRLASNIAEEQIRKIPSLGKELSSIQEMVNTAISILGDEYKSIDEFGKLLHESWLLKRGLTSRITNDVIDDIYRAARRAGALGGKLLGAGGGGFMIFFAKPEIQPAIRRELDSLLHVPFQFEASGSQIVFYQSEPAL